MDNDRRRFLVASAAPGAAGFVGHKRIRVPATCRACRSRNVRPFDIMGVQPIVA
jgi:hypothetical protein